MKKLTHRGENHRDLNISRRQFSKWMLGFGLSVPGSMTSANKGLLGINWFDHSQDTTLIYSAEGKEPSSFSFDCVNSNNAVTVPSDFRGHGLNQHPIQKKHIVCMPRRPGNTGIIASTDSGKVLHTFRSNVNHHMHGHACFSADGQFLYSTESNFKTGEGVIVVRETLNYQVTSIFPSYGIGPHELAIMPDNKTLVVANGGLRTHPDTGRKILNLNTMASNLSYIDTSNGSLIKSYQLKDEQIDFSKASIRHLDVSEDGTVAIALQVQRAAMDHDDLVPLAAIHKQGLPMSVLTAPSQLLRKLDDYMGSVKINLSAKTIAYTSPKGDIIMFWNLDTLAFKGFHIFHDVCGLAVSNNQEFFILSNSTGKIRYINAGTLTEDKDKRLNFPGKHWDNHLLSLTPTA